MVNLKPIDRINKAIKKKEEEINNLNKEIGHLQKQKKELLELPIICPTCEGTGEESYTDTAGSRDIRNCLTCKGLGKVKDIKCVCGNIIDTNMVKVRRNHRPECPWCGKALGGQYDNYGMPQIY